MNMVHLLGRTMFRARALRARLQAYRHSLLPRDVPPTEVTPEWLERGLITPEEWHGWTAGAAARETVTGQGGPTGFCEKTGEHDQLVEDLLTAVAGLKRRQRDQQDIVDIAPEIVQDAKDEIALIMQQIQRAMAVIHQFAPYEAEPEAYEKTSYNQDFRKRNFISDALRRSRYQRGTTGTEQ